MSYNKCSRSSFFTHTYGKLPTSVERIQNNFCRVLSCLFGPKNLRDMLGCIALVSSTTVRNPRAIFDQDIFEIFFQRNITETVSIRSQSGADKQACVTSSYPAIDVVCWGASHKTLSSSARPRSCMFPEWLVPPTIHTCLFNWKCFLHDSICDYIL